MHNTLRKSGLVLALTVIVGCAGKVAPKQPQALPATPTAPAGVKEEAKANETPEQKIARLEAELQKQKMLAEETSEQRSVRLRAEQIEREEKAKLAKAELVKKDTPAMGKARKQLEEEAKKLAEFKKQDADTYASANIQGCPVGTVLVSGEAVQSSSWRVMTSVRIVNASPFPRDIETSFRGIGVAVKNLCAGGSLTLAFYRHTNGPDSEEIILTAVARQPALPVLTESLSLYLYASNINGRRVDNRTWQITGR